MNESSTFTAGSARYELRFAGLFSRGRGYAFPCDAQGHVDMDSLSDQGRNHYFYARAVVGNELSLPIVATVRAPSDPQWPAAQTRGTSVSSLIT